ncbi:phosphonoacetaldehyde reductase [Alienimonas chondri]|uniref:Alcohol dehydrogenase n=1 Tax=Alienimonas chondri TaxID=2681879 RepID=A0ABX1VA14_9PLAN|nr:phosphonoacetaldehyde reductase [Alienimonas chondri]NNJ24122.1 hypothetical protein [Alienimonas chondri]
MQQTVILRPGAVDSVPEWIANYAVERAFVVLDEAAYGPSGAEAALAPCFDAYHATFFTAFEPNPKLEDVVRGIAAFRASGAEIVLAVGGGTAIDLAKLITALVPVGRGQDSVDPSLLEEVVLRNGPLPETALPLIAVPTTAGTGSEATHYAVVYVRGEKYSLAAPSILPNVAVVDSRLTDSLPPRITAATGLDALCQAVESIWAVGATDESIGFASEAIRLALRHLPDAVNGPTPQSRDAMSQASHLAGRAINISKTTLPHALSYGLTSRYGIPHGSAAALTLGPALLFNAGVTEADCTDPRGPAAVRDRIQLLCGLLGADSAPRAAATIERLVEAVGSPISLEAAGVADDARRLAECVNVQRLSNNPRHAEPEDLVRLLRAGRRADRAPAPAVPDVRQPAPLPAPSL